MEVPLAPAPDPLHCSRPVAHAMACRWSPACCAPGPLVPARGGFL